MSATETQNEAKPLSKSALASLYSQNHKPGIVSAAGEMHEAEETLAERQRAVGRVVSGAVSAWTQAGGTAEEIQKLILRDIGGDYTWSYVASWQRAAVVFDSLTPENQTAFGESTEALKSLGRVSDAEKRNELATKLAKSGKVGVRAVREAADKLNGTNGNGRKRSTSKSTTALTTKLAKVRAEIKTPEGVEWTPDLQAFVNALVLVGVRIGKDGRAASKSQEMAAETLAYFGPVAETDDTEK